MKTKHFYEPLVETSSVSLELAEMNLGKDERVHLISLMHANIHSVVIKTVLSELPGEDKKTFLKNLVSNNHEETWRHLEKNIEDAREKIKKSIDDVIKELMDDIKKAKKTK